MKTIICIPGLGGKANIFDNYKESFPDFNLKFVDLIDWRKTQEEVYSLVEKNDQVIFFCSCYGSQIALRAIERFPARVAALAIVEPFFAEFLFMRKVQVAINNAILVIIKFVNSLGIRRTKFKEVHYNFVEKQPMIVQPVYDLMHQRFRDYFEKLKDIGGFELPPRVETKTLLICSPNGFVHTLERRARLKSIFVNSDLVELGDNTHFIMTTSSQEVATALKAWLSKNNI